MRLTGIVLADHPQAPVALEIQAGRIVQVVPTPDEQAQWVALPRLANLHAHVDRALTCTAGRPASLADAIAQAAAYRRQASTADITARARRFIRASIRHGVGTLRTHTDVDPLVALRSITALLAMRQEFAAQCTLEIVAFANAANDLADDASCARLEEAMAMGADWVGAAPAFSKDPHKAIDQACRIAAAHGKGIDLHLDEHLHADRILLDRVIDAALDHGLAGKIAISHGCALSLADGAQRGQMLRRMQQAQATLISLPETNLFLQDRAAGSTPLRRGITIVHEALQHGVAVRLGTDNVRDWFYPYGDGDMLVTAYVAAIAAQMDDPVQLLQAICNGSASLRKGDAADFVLLPATSVEQAISTFAQPRQVWLAGEELRFPEAAEGSLD